MTPFKLTVVGLLVVVAGVGLYWYTRPTPVEVVVRPVDRGQVEATIANTRAGTVTACRRAKIAPQTGGRVVKLPVRRGDRVNSGDLLLQVWNEDLEAQLRLAQDEARAAVATAEQACLEAQLAEREAARIGRLSTEGIVGEQERDRAEAQRDASRAACAAARAAADQARSQVNVVREELAKTTLYAPFAGTVAEVNAELGEVVTPSPPGIPTPPAIDLIEPGCVYVVAPLDEVDAPRAQVGQPARVSLDAFPDKSFEGKVRRVAPYVLDREKQARTVDVEVDIVDPASIPGLAPGYSADVEILLDRRDNVLRIPTEAVYDGRKVLVLNNDRLEERLIEPGLSNWQYTEVLSGLKEGDQVVLSLDRAGVEAGAAAKAAAPPSG